MSAWIVSKNHINEIVQGAFRLKIIGITEIQKTGQMLWEENHKSVNCRYSEKTECPKFEPILCHGISNSALLKAVECLIYQSCERTDWTTSEACRVLKEIKSKIGDDVNDDVNDDEYENAPWGID